MTQTLNINENISIKAVIALTRNGDEVVLEENGKPIAKVTLIEEETPQPEKRVLGLGRGEGYFMSDDFDEELPDDFWGFDKEL